MRKSIANLFLLVLTLVLSTAVGAVTVEVQGSASIVNGAVNKARLMAIRDAIRQAAIQASANVVTSSVISSNVMMQDNTHVRASAEVRNVQVLDEWQDDHQVTVLVRAEVPEQAGKDDSVRTYRRKVAVMQFHVHDRRSIHDLPGIEFAYPRAFLRKLEQRGGVIGVDATAYVMHGREAGSGGLDRDKIRNLAESLDAQFVVTGEFTDLSMVEGWFSDTRQINLSVQVYDGVTGSLVSHHHYAKNVKDADVSGLMSFGSEAFNKTALGIAMQDVLERQTRDVASGIGRLPVTVRVIRSEGRQVYFNAGASSLINVGDMMMAYKVEDEPVTLGMDGSALGYVEAPVATITVKKLQPLFAMGELETDEVRLVPGDLLRFGW